MIENRGLDITITNATGLKAAPSKERGVDTSDTSTRSDSRVRGEFYDS